MNTQSLICIITPVYNAEKFLSATVESVRQQDYTNWRLILVNDCSSDGSDALCCKLQQKDERIAYLAQQKNGGPAHTRNVGIDAAISMGADYLAFLDSDDILEPNYLSTLHSIAEDCRADIVWCNFYEYKFGYAERKRTVFHRLPSLKPVEKKQLISCFFENRQGLGCLWNKLYRVEFITRNNLRINEERVRAEDWEFNLMAFQCNPVVVPIEDALYNYIHYPTPSVMTTYRENDFKMAKRTISLMEEVALRYDLKDKLPIFYNRFVYNTICFISKGVNTNQQKEKIIEVCEDKVFRSKISLKFNNSYLTLKYYLYSFLLEVRLYKLLFSLMRFFKKC